MAHRLPTPAEIARTTLIEALRKFGCVEGGTVRLEVRSAQNDLDSLQQPAGSPGQVRGACDERDQTPHR